jgi:hypothetical protein
MSIPLWESTDVVRFSYDPDENEFRFQCPHRQTAHRLPLDPERGWVIVQVDPLTVTPSIHCLDCGCHGFITNGEWIAV